MELRSDMTPYEWLLLQTSLWTEELTQAFRLVTTLPNDTSDPVIQGALKLFQEQHHYCLPVFLNEAQIFMHSCVDKFPLKQPEVFRLLFSKICSTFRFFSGMLTILGRTGLDLKDVRELLLSQIRKIKKNSWVDVHFIDFAPFYTVDEVLPYFSPFVGGEDSITKNIRAILSQFYLDMLQLNFTSNYLIHLSFAPPSPLLHLSFASPLPLLRLSFASPSPLLRLSFASLSPLLRLSFASPSPLLRLSFASPSPLFHLSFASPSPLLRLSFASPSPLLYLFFASPSPLLHLSFIYLFVV
jgi:hypothetical protein